MNPTYVLKIVTESKSLNQGGKNVGKQCPKITARQAIAEIRMLFTGHGDVEINHKKINTGRNHSVNVG
jgi:hypothetical protein